MSSADTAATLVDTDKTAGPEPGTGHSTGAPGHAVVPGEGHRVPESMHIEAIGDVGDDDGT